MKITAKPRNILDGFKRDITPPLAHILIIESDVTMAQLIELELGYEGYQVTVAHDGMVGLIAARNTHPDLLILGWQLPGVSCLEICQRLRTTGSTMPIIVLTAENQTGDRIASLKAGADDCISQPFSLGELIARAQAHLRHLQQRTSDLLQFDNLVLNRKTRQVYRDSQMIDLTAREFDLLDYFMMHPNQVLTREQILDTVWGYDFLGTSNIIEVYIRYLRKKLEGHNASRLIHTLRNVGYALRS